MRRAATKLASYRDLPLAWKLSVPSVVLIVFAGATGGFLISRDLSSRARGSVNQALLQASLNVRSDLQNEELSLLESANLAANLEGMAAAATRRDRDAATRLLQTVAALKRDLSVVAVVPADGAELVELGRNRAGVSPVVAQASPIARIAPVRKALAGSAGQRFASVVRFRERTLFAIAAPICGAAPGCDAVGVAVAGRWLDEVASSTTAAPGLERAGRPGVALFDVDGELLTAVGLAPKGAPKIAADDASLRRSGRAGEKPIDTLFSSFEAGGQRLGTVAVTLPTDSALGSLRGTALRLALLLILILAGIVALAFVVSRLVLKQVRSLLHSSRSLGRGDLAARAPVLGEDELGELASRFNEMADQLQASHEQLEHRVTQRTREVQRLLRQRTEFFASISHELRTPLAIILSRAKLMLDPPDRRRVDTRESLENIRDSGEKLLSLVNDILNLARAESGRIDVSLAPLSVREVVGEIRRSIDALAASRGVGLRVDLASDLPAVRADPRWLREVLLNVTENAFKYTPPGGSVRITAQTRRKQMEISIADNGVGIAANIGERIFEPFYRVPGSAPQHGDPSTGLGLALAKRLIEAQGGSIGYTSRPGEGTTFVVRLALASPNGKTSTPATSRGPRAAKRT